MADHEFIAIIDFGGQYTQLIARRVREANVFCEILLPDTKPADLRGRNLKGIILSGGPASVYEKGAPRCDPKLLDLGVPVLGICYGMQLACLMLGSKVSGAREREFGRTPLTVKRSSVLFKGVPKTSTVW